MGLGGILNSIPGIVSLTIGQQDPKPFSDSEDPYIGLRVWSLMCAREVIAVDMRGLWEHEAYCRPLINELLLQKQDGKRDPDLTALKETSLRLLIRSLEVEG